MGRLSLAWARWVLAPWWAAQVFTDAKTADVNPILGDAGLNRRGLHVWRGRLAHRLAARRRARLGRRIAAEDRRAFERDGLIARPGFVEAELFARMVAELQAFRGEAIETLEGDTLNRRITLDAAALRRLPACREAIASPSFQRLLRYVSSFDAPPRLFVQTLFSHAVKAKPDHQKRLHMDTFHPTMKAWLFLQDVGEDGGPFVYVPRSHVRSGRRDAWERRMSVEAADPATPSVGGSFRIDAGALKRIGCGAPVPVAVAANTLVVADTYGFHARGDSTAPSVRVALYATSRPNPFVPWASLVFARLPVPAPLRRWTEAATQRARRGRGVLKGSRRVSGVGPWTAPAPWSGRGETRRA
jgi:hypothetical protein